MDDGLHFNGVAALFLGHALRLPSGKDGVIEFEVPHKPSKYAMCLSQDAGPASWSSLEPLWTSVCFLWQELPDKFQTCSGVLVSCVRMDPLRDDSTLVMTDILRGRWLARVTVFIRGGEFDTVHGGVGGTRYDKEGNEMPPETTDGIIRSSGGYISRGREWCIR